MKTLKRHQNIALILSEVFGCRELATRLGEMVVHLEEVEAREDACKRTYSVNPNAGIRWTLKKDEMWCARLRNADRRNGWDGLPLLLGPVHRAMHRIREKIRILERYKFLPVELLDLVWKDGDLVKLLQLPVGPALLRVLKDMNHYRDVDIEAETIEESHLYPDEYILGHRDIPECCRNYEMGVVDKEVGEDLTHKCICCPSYEIYDNGDVCEFLRR